MARRWMRMGNWLFTRTLWNVLVLSLLAAAYSGLAVWKEFSDYSQIADQSSVLYAAISLVLGLLLVFRTNTAYDRWWEARKLWGHLVNVSRNLAIKSRTLVELDADERDRLARYIAAYAEALKDHLRGDSSPELVAELESLAGRAVAFRHLPDYVTLKLFEMFQSWRAGKRMTEQTLWLLDQECREFLEICGGCERILKTPLAPSYRVFLRHSILLVLLSLPWGIVEDFQEWTVLLVLIVSYSLIGIEVIAETIEEPFGTDDDDLDLSGICTGIRTTVSEALSVPS